MRQLDFSHSRITHRRVGSAVARAAALGALALAPWVAPQAPAQSRGLPSPEVIANADRFDPPKLARYAARLAKQPDMSGTWTTMVPKGTGNGPTFDPAHTVYPPRLPSGEASFGPLPGTYIQGIPYNAAYQKKYRELIKETTEGKSRDTFAACIPYGVPRMIGDAPTPFDIIQSPDVMIWSNNYTRTERRIFFDGRAYPTESDPETGGNGPSYSGHSIGHWEGNTLVIDTVNMAAGYFDETPAPYSGELHMLERVRLIAPNILEDQMTFTDPVTMVGPWVVTRYFQRKPGPKRYLELNDRPCVANVRIDANGFQVAILPSELDQASASSSAPPSTSERGSAANTNCPPQSAAHPH
ncbi:MAG TPA: hypothetical protein VMD49_01395 [Steroidobacteraceae bacterium]|nr:hypothetical protein [Steroidobacteraceae bacterium]